MFPGYAQEQWVIAQRYQDAPWHELVAFWRAFNLHLARVMAAVPEEVRLRPRGVTICIRSPGDPYPSTSPSRWTTSWPTMSTI
jgi:hypothetical protein